VKRPILALAGIAVLTLAVAASAQDKPTEATLDLYKTKCLACHLDRGKKSSATRIAPACPRASKQCASCHMPKLSLPGAHYKFTDHLIRIYNPSEAYPD